MTALDTKLPSKFITDYKVTWQKLPDDYILPDDPVDNINQPLLAMALSDSLETACILTNQSLTTTNYGICANVNNKVVVKAPDWSYIPQITVPRDEVFRSYTPHLQGDIPVIVMEFLSKTEGTEYSTKPTYPYGKWFYYEKILQIPIYAIFEPDQGILEVYHLDSSRVYQLQQPDSNHRYYLPEMNLFLGVWEGIREGRVGYWLRFWDQEHNLLLWGLESAKEAQQQVEAEKQRTEVEKQRADRAQQRAEVEKQRAENLLAQLRAAGIEPNL